MSPVRRLLDELVERRLWPIALALVIALVAIPLAVRSGSDSSAERELAVIAADPAPLAKPTPAVVLVGPPSVRTRPGKLRDPFRRAKVKAAKDSSTQTSTTSSTSSTSSSGGSSSSDSSSSSGSGSDGESTTTTPPDTTPTQPTTPTTLVSRSVYVTAGSFSGPGIDYEHELRRLAVFGNKENPALLYLGVSRGGEYAIYLLGPKATAAGDDGACIVADSCRAIGLRRGDTLEVSVAEADGTKTPYILKLTSLRRVVRHTKTAAQRERERVAEGGRDAVHEFAKDPATQAALDQLRFGPVSGTVALVRSP